MFRVEVGEVLIEADSESNRFGRIRCINMVKILQEDESKSRCKKGKQGPGHSRAQNTKIRF